MKTPEKISIKLKFRIMLICFAVYAGITGLSFWYLIDHFNEIETSYSKEIKLKNDITELRNIQYELFNSYSGKKDKEREDSLLDNISSVCKNIESELAELNEITISTNRKTIQSIKILNEEFETYKLKIADISKIENEITELTQDGGRLASSRQTVKKIIFQFTLAGINKMFEEAEKYEQEFILNSKIDDYKKFNKQIESINNTLKNVNTSNILIKYQIQKLMDQLYEYKMTFNLLFSKQLMIGLENFDGYKGMANVQIKTMLTDLEELMVESSLAREKVHNNAIIKVVIIQIIIIILGISFFLILFWSVNKPITKLSNYLKQLLRGELVTAEITHNSTNEMDMMSLQLSQFIKNLKEKQIFTEDIGNGKPDKGFKLLSNDDELGNSLINMKRSLEEEKEQQRLRRQEDEIQDKINIGLAEFGNILRKNNNNLEALCNETLRNLIHYMSANYGAIYIYIDEEGEDPYLEMKATYAADRKKFIQKRVNLYEGIVGTCAVEKTMQIIDDIPKDYIKIGSGFGNTKPSNLIVIPLLLNEEILGVIELCRTEKFEEYKIKFLKRLAEDIASTISYVKVNNQNLFKLEAKGRRLDDYTKRLHKAKNEIAQKQEIIKLLKEENEKLKKDIARFTDNKSQR
ncbi:MAG: GAF domain-containing protein [Bacteroidales bacterium]|nr:GAF domain-containing protein [Bacteroidales bacterium]